MESAGEFTVYAHRGYTEKAHPENTLAALEHARRHRARAVEVDMRVTRDDRIVLMHDRTLDRTTTCRGPVRRHTAASIRHRCRTKLGKERVPTLKQVLEWAARHRMRVILEVKVDAPVKDAWTPGMFVTLDRMITEHGLQDEVILHSFSARRLRLAKEAAPSLHVQVITQRWAAVAPVRAWADGVNVWARHLNAARVERLHADGLYVLGRDSDEPADWRRIRRSGADGLVTDAVPGALRIAPPGR
nr:glycerophosphodiester phosphodiesterase family protein [Nocardioides sp. zg-DK7169]